MTAAKAHQSSSGAVQILTLSGTVCISYAIAMILLNASFTTAFEWRGLTWMGLFAGGIMIQAAGLLAKLPCRLLTDRGPIILVLALLVLSVNAPWHFEAASLFYQWLALIVAALALSNAFEILEPGFAQLIGQLFLAILVLLALHGLAESLYLFDLLRAEVSPLLLQGDAAAFFASTRARSTMGQANGLAGFLILSLPMLCVALAASRKRQLRWRLVVVISVLALGLAATQSRAGILAGVTVLGVALRYFLLSPRLRQIALAFLAVAAVAWLGVFAALLGFIESPRFETLLLRRDYWAVACTVITEHPWGGVGIGSYAEYARSLDLGPNSFSRFAHSAPLTLVAEGGAFLIFFVLGFCHFALRPKRWLRAKNELHQSECPRLSAKMCAIPYLVLGLALISSNPGDGIEFYLADRWVVTLGNLALGLAIMWLVGPLSEKLFLQRKAWACLALLGFLIHACFDFDLYVYGLLTGLTLIGTLARVRNLPQANLVASRAQMVAGIAIIFMSLTALLFCSQFVREHLAAQRMHQEWQLQQIQPADPVALLDSISRQEAPALDFFYLTFSACLKLESWDPEQRQTITTAIQNLRAQVGPLPHLDSCLERARARQ